MSHPTIRIDKAIPDRRVNCSTHGHVPGYIVCSCIAKFSEKPAHILHPRPGKLGELLCKRREGHEQWEYQLVCERCALERGFVERVKPKLTVER